VLVGEADPIQVLAGDADGFLLGALEHLPLGDGEVLQRRQVRKQVECLEDHADLRRTASMSTSGSVTSIPPTKTFPEVGSSADTQPVVRYPGGPTDLRHAGGRRACAPWSRSPRR
jgi:hypothetical protein